MDTRTWSGGTVEMLVVVVCPWCEEPAEVHGADMRCERCNVSAEIAEGPAPEAVELAAA